MEFKISEELATALLNYLAAKPYAEVNQLIDNLQNLKPLSPPAPAQPKKPSKKSK